MTPTSQPSLDPRKNPWKRGDLCTSSFEKNGFVTAVTSEYLEVRWFGGNVEKFSMSEADNLLRMGHADGPAPDGRTNLENLETIESLALTSKLIAERVKTVTNESEKQELDSLVRRLFAENKCAWDTQNTEKIMQMLLQPERVGPVFRVQDRIHRAFCKKHVE